MGICTLRMGRKPLTCLASVVMVLGMTAAAPAAEDVPRLAHVFQDNMVLQRDVQVPVWGWAEPGTKVEVSFADQTKQATAGDDGRWQLALDAMPASSEGRTLTVSIGETTIERKNVLVGEVWLAAGQSNMNHSGPDRDTGVYPHYQSPGAAGGKPEIRIMGFGFGVSLEPQEDADPLRRGDAPWSVLQEEPAPKSMNLSRYFARVVRDGLDVPVGIIHVAVSGTNQAAWMARETLEEFSGGKDHANAYEAFFAAREAGLAKGKGAIRSWADFKKVEAQWRKSPKGRLPGGLSIKQYPTVLYNTRIHPVAPYAMRGVIWHQGEAGPGGPYGARLAAMARQYRELWGQDLAFVWGTLSRHTQNSPPLAPRIEWFYRSGNNVEIRKALEEFGDDDSVALVEFFDLGDHGTHFEQKAEAGRRMGLAALTEIYGQDHIYSGPRLVEHTIDGSKATLRFDLVGEGIAYRPSIDGISGVVVVGKDGKNRWAEVEVTGPATVEVTHPDGAEIVAIGYAETANPHETLVNSAGLPASSFRINCGRVPYLSKAPGMVRQVGPKESRGTMSLAHVRRDGYVFKLMNGKAPVGTTVTVDAFVSSEWDGVEVVSGGKPIAAELKTIDGQKFATFEAPVKGEWIIVAAPGKAGKFKDVNRY